MERKPSAAELLREGSLEAYGEVKPDSKKRVVLKGPLASHYRVYRNDAGQIILDPQVLVPAAEAWLFKNKKALASVRKGLEESAGVRARKWRSFASHAGDDIE